MNEKLIKLLSKNPTFPILVNVGSDVCYLGQDSGQIGEVKDVCLNKYVWHHTYIPFHNNMDNPTYIKIDEKRMVDYEDREDIFHDFALLPEYEDYTDEKLEQIIEELDWKEAIILYVAEVKD